MDAQFLNLVKSPARYIGREVNHTVKDWNAARVKICLCFPEIYELGMSNLGQRLLYGIVNYQQNYLAERVFAPDLDLEEQLRQKGISISSLESDRPLSEFDIIGVTLASELSYSNFLTILSLSSIPLKREDRRDDDPIVLAGGTGAFTPEPMTDFCDAFLVGEGEEAILSILKVLEKNRSAKRREKLLHLSRLPGVYVPSLHQPRYDQSGVYRGLLSQEKTLYSEIKKTVIGDFENAFFPEKWLVPYLPVVHDRIGIEIMRGCTNRCQFCQARVIYGPCRTRSPQKILEIAKNALTQTGYAEISLLSLSTGDYPRLVELRNLLEPLCRRRSVKLSLPSLRADTLLLSAAQPEKGRKHSSLTFAPESSERLRRQLKKELTDADLLNQASQAKKSGWQHLKLYFMLGLPEETEADLKEIVRLVTELSRILRLNLSFNTFIPKPHTPLERASMATEGEIREKTDFLRGCLKKNRYLSLRFHPYQQSFLEAILSRSDRRTGKAILGAWQKGSRFDGWDEHFRFDLWTEALSEAEIDCRSILEAQPENAVLPWSHIVI
ncbi:MAG: TIGR03960 family B12-binding radical SAM protein [Candidatus Omnitrophota bacterium]